MAASSHVRLLDASDPEHSGPIDKLAYEIALASSLKSGDLVLCAAGECIPADGVVIEGTADVGEHVARGDSVPAGYVVLRVTA
jgi:cation transport ATPase